jgi:hypothetical protein
MNIADNERFKEDRYKIDNVAKSMGHSVLHLSSYHCELHPFGLV